MRHKKLKYRLGRTTSHRRALMGNLSTALFRHERIVTTLTKAKALRSNAEKLITLGKRGDLHARRQVLKAISDKKIVKKVFDNIAPRFSDRNGGYTRIMKIAPRRGDGAEMAIIELVDFVERQREAELAAEKAKSAKSKKTKTAKAKTEKTKSKAAKPENQKAEKQVKSKSEKPKESKSDKQAKDKAEKSKTTKTEKQEESKNKEAREPKTEQTEGPASE